MSAIEAAVGTAESSAASTEATTVQAMGAPTRLAGDPAAAVEADVETASAAAVGPGKALGMGLAPAVAREVALGLLAGCAPTKSWSGTKCWLCWDRDVLGKGVSIGKQKSGVVMT